VLVARQKFVYFRVGPGVKGLNSVRGFLLAFQIFLMQPQNFMAFHLYPLRK